jgi:hypothetical protein
MPLYAEKLVANLDYAKTNSAKLEKPPDLGI